MLFKYLNYFINISAVKLASRNLLPRWKNFSHFAGGLKFLQLFFVKGVLSKYDLSAENLLPK